MMRGSRVQPRQTDGGYTLIELLISLTILALLLAMVPGTLRLGKRAWETPGGVEDVPAAAALAFAERNLRSALPIYQRDANGLPQIVFEGREQSLSYVADLLSGPSGGGLYRIDIGPVQSPGFTSSGLAVRVTLFRPDGNLKSAATEERELNATYSAVQFRYFGSPSPGAAAEWQSTWHRSDRLPDLVDIVATSRNTKTTADAQYRSELKLRPIL